MQHDILNAENDNLLSEVTSVHLGFAARSYIFIYLCVYIYVLDSQGKLRTVLPDYGKALTTSTVAKGERKG